MESARVRTRCGVCLGLDVQHAGLEDRTLLSGGIVSAVGPIASVVAMSPPRNAAVSLTDIHVSTNETGVLSDWFDRVDDWSTKFAPLVGVPRSSLVAAGRNDVQSPTTPEDGLQGGVSDSGPAFSFLLDSMPADNFTTLSPASMRSQPPFMRIEDFFLRYRGPGGDLPGRVPLLITPDPGAELEAERASSRGINEDPSDAASILVECHISLLQPVPTSDLKMPTRLNGDHFPPEATTSGSVGLAQIETLNSTDNPPSADEESPDAGALVEGAASETGEVIDPIGSGLRLAAINFDPASWDEAVTLLIDGVDDLLSEIGEIGGETAYLPWVVGAGLAITATGVARKVRTRPRFALSTSGSSCVEPSRGGRC